jgi:hypothetical protein
VKSVTDTVPQAAGPMGATGSATGSSSAIGLAP